MTNVTEQATEPKPAYWYGIPHGYVSMDLAPPVQQLETLVEEIRNLPGELRDRADRFLRFYAGFVYTLNAHRVDACAVGMHPDGTGDFALSVLTLSTVPTSGAKPDLVIASVAGASSERPEDGVVPLELPCGTAFLAERKRRTVAPGKPADGEEAAQGDVWQGTVTAPGPDASSVIVLQLVTSSIDQSDDYRNVLLGVAHTLSFTDPTLPESAESDQPIVPSPGSIGEAVQNDFG